MIFVSFELGDGVNICFEIVDGTSQTDLDDYECRHDSLGDAKMKYECRKRKRRVKGTYDNLN